MTGTDPMSPPLCQSPSSPAPLAALARGLWLALAALGLAALTTGLLNAGPLAAQDLEVFDPNEAFAQPAASAARAPADTSQDTGAIDADLMPPSSAPSSAPSPAPAPAQPVPVAALPADAGGFDN
ncbi:MAG: hypothetical protein AAFY81_08095, partial [Pseudomonadota bacterium]